MRKKQKKENKKIIKIMVIIKDEEISRSGATTEFFIFLPSVVCDIQKVFGKNNIKIMR